MSIFDVGDVEIRNSLIEGNNLVILCTLTVSTTKINTHALINCGATSIAFVDKAFTHYYNLPLRAQQKL